MSFEPKQPLTAQALDRMLTPSRTLWGLKAIAGFLCLPVGTVRRLAKRPEVPIHKPAGSGTWCAETEDLDAWKRGRLGC